jgi:hypothetical protein
MGNQPVRWFAVAVLGLNAIDRDVIPVYPFWSRSSRWTWLRCTGCANGSRANLTALSVAQGPKVVGAA